MGYFQACTPLKKKRIREDLNKYNKQHNRHSLEHKIQLRKRQHLTKKEKIKVGLVKIIRPMVDNHLMNLSLLILKIIRIQATMKRRAARKRVKETA